MEAPRGAREPTGTNGPTLTNTSTTNVYTVWLTDIQGCSSPLCGSQPTQPHTLGDLSEYWLNHLVVVIAAGKRPASIPNLEAKPASADGTAPGRVWESRTPPQQPSKGGARNTRSKGPTPLRIPSHRRAHNAQTFNTGGTACLRSKLLVELDAALIRTRFFTWVHFCSTHALLVRFSSRFFFSSDESHTGCFSTAPYAH